MEITRIDASPSYKGPEDWFTGPVRADPLFDAFAIQENLNGKVVDWMEKVKDEQFNNK